MEIKRQIRYVWKKIQPVFGFLCKLANLERQNIFLSNLTKVVGFVLYALSLSDSKNDFDRLLYCSKFTLIESKNT